jgi:hypothetical protein
MSYSPAASAIDPFTGYVSFHSSSHAFVLPGTVTHIVPRFAYPPPALPVFALMIPLNVL